MHKQPILPKKIFIMIAVVWLFINIVLFTLWAMGYFPTRDFIIGMFLVNAQPLVTVFVEILKWKKEFHKPSMNK
jgi:hypothetical protein